MGAKNTKDEGATSDDNLKDIEFISVPDKDKGKEKDKEPEGEKKDDEKDKEPDATMSPAVAMCFYAGKGDVENMKKIYLSHPKSVNESDVPVENKEEKKKKKKEDEETRTEKVLPAISGDFPLHKAAAEGQLAAVELLLNWEADLENKNRIGSTALHRAASHGQIETVKKLLENGSSVDSLNKIGSSPLHCAAFSGFVEVAKLICASGGFKHIRRPNMAGMTPLDYAKTSKALWEFFLTYDVKSSSRSSEQDHKRGDKTVTLHSVTVPSKGSFHKKHLAVDGDRGSFHKKTVTIQDGATRKPSQDDVSQPITLHIRTP
jgi:hypothetical protein